MEGEDDEVTAAAAPTAAEVVPPPPPPRPEVPRKIGDGAMTRDSPLAFGDFSGLLADEGRGGGVASRVRAGGAGGAGGGGGGRCGGW